jgi:hypothetical protein
LIPSKAGAFGRHHRAQSGATFCELFKVNRNELNSVNARIRSTRAAKVRYRVPRHLAPFSPPRRNRLNRRFIICPVRPAVTAEILIDGDTIVEVLGLVEAAILAREAEGLKHCERPVRHAPKTVLNDRRLSEHAVRASTV